MVDIITIDPEEIKQFESDLKTFAARAYPFATKKTNSDAAFETMRRTKTIIKEKMKNRTGKTGGGFTVRSIQVDLTGNRTLRVSAQEAVVGSVADYMERQEFGGSVAKKGKHGVPLATTVASGEGRGARPRRKLPRSANKLAKIRLVKRLRRFKSRKQEIFVKTLLAARSGNKFVFLDTRDKKAIYKITGRGRLDKNGRITGVKMDMVYDLSHKSVRIPRTQTLLPATRETIKRLPEIYRDALIDQLKFHKLFKG